MVLSRLNTSVNSSTAAPTTVEANNDQHVNRIGLHPTVASYW
jgi:hypothetical protein